MDLQANADRFTGQDYIRTYDRHRPHPPEALLDCCLRYLGKTPAATVLDLGCGTGISTLAWRGRAQRIIGAEPSSDMRAIAEEKLRPDENHLSFLDAFGHDIPLEDASVDIICCSQSFHWMEPVSTLREIERVLAPGGVFCVYDCQWPPTFDAAAEQAYQQLFAKVKEVTATLPTPPAHHFPKDQHFENILNSGHFPFVKNGYFHQEEAGGLERFAGIALSQGGLQTLLDRGFSEGETGLREFKRFIDQHSTTRSTLLFHYSAIFAKKG